MQASKEEIKKAHEKQLRALEPLRNKAVQLHEFNAGVGRGLQEILEMKCNQMLEDVQVQSAPWVVGGWRARPGGGGSTAFPIVCELSDRLTD